MKSNVALLLVLVLVGIGLWYLGGHVARHAGENTDFVNLYNAALAARKAGPIYPVATPVPRQETPVPAEVDAPADEAGDEQKAEAPAPPAADEGPVLVNAPASIAAEVEPEALSSAAETPPVEEEAEPAVERAAAEVEEAEPAVESAAAEVEEAEPAVESAGAEVEEAEPAVESAGALTEVEKAAPPEPAFGHPPYMAIMFIPLTFIESIENAALAWYWINVVLVFIVIGLSMYALSGNFSPGRKGMFLVPLFAAAPFIYYFLPTEAVTLLALVFVLVALSLFRSKHDVISGFVASLAVFSPFGWATGIYLLLKRSWNGLLGFLVGVVLLLALLPIFFFGPARAWNEVEGYRTAALSPYVSELSDAEHLRSPDNQSVWGILMRRTSDIAYVGEMAEGYGQARQLAVPQVTSNWTVVVFVVVGVVILAASVLGVLRRLPDRAGPIVGLEGSVVVLATLVLSPFTRLPAMVVLIFPLLAVVYMIMSTSLKSLVHHVNYVGLVVATAFFYLSFDPQFKAVGSAFAGTFILWVAVLGAVNRFKPQLVYGRAAQVFEAGRKRREEKPVKLARVSKRKKKETPASGVLPMPAFASEEEEADQAPEGMAQNLMNVEQEELPPVEVEESKREPEEPDEKSDSDPKTEPE